MIEQKIDEELEEQSAPEKIQTQDDICPECQGTGKVREWSTPLAIIGLFWLRSRLICHLLHYFVQHLQRGIGIPLAILFGLGVFGILPLIDRETAKTAPAWGDLKKMTNSSLEVSLSSRQL